MAGQITGLEYDTISDTYSDDENKYWRKSGIICVDRIAVTISIRHFQTVSSLNNYLQSFTSLLRLSHPGVIKVYDWQLSQNDRGAFVVTELTEPLEESLSKDLITRRETWNWYSNEELWRIMWKLIEVLSFAHSQGVSHRCIHPENCYFRNDQIKLGGFEHAAWHLEIQRSRSTLVGRKTYYSPELRQALSSLEATGKRCEYDPIKADVYALGVLILDLASLGEVSSERNQLNVESLMARGSEHYAEIMTWVALMLTRDKDQRPSFADLGRRGMW